MAFLPSSRPSLDVLAILEPFLFYGSTYVELLKVRLKLRCKETFGSDLGVAKLCVEISNLYIEDRYFYHSPNSHECNEMIASSPQFTSPWIPFLWIVKPLSHFMPLS